MYKSINLSIYFIADPSLCAGRDVADVVRAALRGGATMVQYRDKQNSSDIILHNAKSIREVVRSGRGENGAAWPVPFLINDHVEIACEAGADGVHLGQDDMNPDAARRLLGPGKIIGLTAFTEAQIRAVDEAVVDYIGLGPFYRTKTDKGKPVLEADRFRALAAISPVPVVGIGGITPDNAAAVLEAGAAGVAMMRSISEASDPEDAVRAFKSVIARRPTGLRGNPFKNHG